MSLATLRRHGRRTALAVASPLRRADPRTKLLLSLAASLAVMLSVQKIALVLLIYATLLVWARLWRPAAWQIWRLKWVLIVLFALDWWLVDLDLAVVVSLRLILLATAFSLFVATTTPEEFRLTLEWLRLPYRYAFSVSLAFQSVGLLDEEWRAIREAQQARGAWSPPKGWRELVENVRDFVALSVPAIVLTTRRAWSMTEAAYTRGFDSPHRRSYRRLHLAPLDGVLLAGIAAAVVIVLLI